MTEQQAEKLLELLERLIKALDDIDRSIACNG